MPDPPHAGGGGRVQREDQAGPAGLTGRSALIDGLRGVLLDAADAVRIDVHGRTDSAVLVPLYLDAAGHLHAVFTKRRDDLRRHPGEISFPGGRRDEGEPHLMATALREAEEEIGLDPSGVELVGALQPTPTFVTDYAIYPFVGIIEPGHVWRLEAQEVAEVLEFRLADVRAGYGRRRLIRRGMPFRTDAYQVGDSVIWGATARIVADLLDRTQPWLDRDISAHDGRRADAPPSG